MINYKADGTPETFNWNGINKNEKLESISVFNSNCVKISLSDRELIVSPIGFHLFTIVSTELNELEKLLREKIASHPTSVLCAYALNQGTPQHSFINRLSAGSTEQRLNELSTFTLANEENLKTKQNELLHLNKPLLENEVYDLIAQGNELSSLISKIKAAQAVLNLETWERLININGEIAALRTKTQKGIKEIAENNGIEFYETNEFQSFIEAAENYIKILNNANYPNSDDVCVYCQQPLEIPAKELLSSYRTVLNDRTKENLQQLIQEKAALISHVLQVDTRLVILHRTFGLGSDEKPNQPNEIIVYNKDLDLLKTAFVTDKVFKGDTFDFDYTHIIEHLTNKSKEIASTASSKKALLSAIESKELELKREIAELKDRKLLSTKVADIKTVISNHRIVSKLNSSYYEFNTTSISRKTTEARDELLRQNFNQIFKNELKALRKSNIHIELSFATDRGNSRVYQNIQKHVLSDILSEGEQKAIALAEFLTELQLDTIKAPVIFDDPVNSLDHRIIDEVAKRLVELSKERQIIVFTHSILLFNSFIQQKDIEKDKKSKVEFGFYMLRINSGVTGIVEDVQELNSYKDYTEKLKKLLQEKSNERSEQELAAIGYGHLRSAIEVTVENLLLQGVVRRYRKGIAFPSLMRIEGSKIDIHKGKLNDIYEKCCVSIDAHSSPSIIHTTPTIDELKMDYEEFQNIRKDFT